MTPQARETPPAAPGHRLARFRWRGCLLCYHGLARRFERAHGQSITAGRWRARTSPAIGRRPCFHCHCPAGACRRGSCLPPQPRPESTGARYPFGWPWTPARRFRESGGSYGSGRLPTVANHAATATAITRSSCLPESAPQVSRSLAVNRTRNARNSPMSALVTGPGFSSPNQPDQERATAYRDSSGPESRSDAHCATIVGDWEEPFGESRLKPL